MPNEAGQLRATKNYSMCLFLEKKTSHCFFDQMGHSDWLLGCLEYSGGLFDHLEHCCCFVGQIIVYYIVIYFYSSHTDMYTYFTSKKTILIALLDDWASFWAFLYPVLWHRCTDVFHIVICPDITNIIIYYKILI